MTALSSLFIGEVVPFTEDLLFFIGTVFNTSENGSTAVSKTGIPDWLSIAVTLFSGGVGAYLLKQLIERRKLKRGLQSEISYMNGLETCKRSMESRDHKPSNQELSPNEVPPVGTIPTQIYEQNVGRLGILKSDDIEKIIQFYSQVLYYKAVIADIRGGVEVPDPDQDDLYDSIPDLETKRRNLFGEGWLDD